MALNVKDDFRNKITQNQIITPNSSFLNISLKNKKKYKKELQN